MKTPKFDELVGPEVVGEDRARMRRAHDLLVAAGPPPDLPEELEPAPVRAFPRRRGLTLLLAAALATAAFAGGWFVRGGDDDTFDVRRVVPMHSTADAPGASALIKLGYPDADGNWQMLVVVRGLRPLEKGGYYELLLTKEGKPIATCGSFKVRGRGETVVRLGASYKLGDFDGWVVRPYIHGRDAFNEKIFLRT